MAIVYCSGTYEERMEQTKACIERVQPRKYVDRAVIIGDETLSEESVKWLEEHGCEVHIHAWEDSMVKMRNQYLSYCNYGDWIVVSDPDELFCEDFMRDIRKLIKEAESRGIILLLINSHDIKIKLDGTRKERVSSFFKNLIFKYSPEVRYQGVGKEKTVHEILLLPPSAQQATIPRKYYYEHMKSEIDVWERAFRNVWIAGGGNNVGNTNPRWRPLHQITERLGLKSWSEVRGYLRSGNIDKELLKWIRDCQKESGWDWQNEMFDCLIYYKALHPKELPDILPASELKPGPPSPGSPPEIMAYVEKCYLEILGRHADDQGKQQYSDMILTGKIKREELPDALRKSKEYGQRFGGRLETPAVGGKLETPAAKVLPAGEKVRINVPVDVDVRIGPDAFTQALRKSRVYWETIKPRLDLGEYLESLMEDKDEFYKWFYSNKDNLTLKEMVKKIREEPWSEEDREKIVRRLKQLGYMG